MPDGFADVVIMNFPMNHLSDGEALLAVKEVAALPPALFRSLAAHGTDVCGLFCFRFGASSRTAAAPFLENKTGDHCTHPF